MDFLTPFRTGHGLNAVERWKQERHPLDVLEAVLSTYAQEGPGAIAAVPGEMERLKWVGLYPQRQGGDAFMLRIKVPGGRLNASQVRVIGQITDLHARGGERNSVWGEGFCDLTTRQDIQLHWLKIADIPGIWERLDTVGLTTVQACGDSARNVLGCPVAGLDPDEAFDASSVALEISAFFTGHREYANLPRKFKISVTGCLDDCAQAEINDVGLTPARSIDGRLGFNVAVGGGLSDGPRLASDIDLFVSLDQAVETTRGIAQVFGELGNRENRGQSRMRYLVQELGPERFRHELVMRLSFPAGPGGEALTRRYRGDHVGVHPQRQRGLNYVGLSVTVGRISGQDLIEVARLAEVYGDGGIRLSTDQNLVLVGVPDERVTALSGEPLLARHSPWPGPFERGVVACTGNEFCRFAIIETKVRALAWARHMDRYLSTADSVDNASQPSGRGPDDTIRMHVSGCSASCAQPQIADIGFRGETAKVAGVITEAVDVGLGGSLGTDVAFIDWVEGAKPVEEVPAALERLVDNYLAERHTGERFHQWARRRPNRTLRQLVSPPSAMARVAGDQLDEEG